MTTLEKALSVIVETVHPKKVILFGSHARGTATPQRDYDFLVVTVQETGLRALAQDAYLRMRHIGAPVDLVMVNEKRLAEVKDNPFLVYREACAEGKTVYEQQ